MDKQISTCFRKFAQEILDSYSERQGPNLHEGAIQGEVIQRPREGDDCL